ncbi:hypothetical protein [Dongia sp.]|uniref:hypothetical protein n=1 Tax=Dongia sp. TaxID=1977262 RepID=UPI0035B18F39
MDWWAIGISVVVSILAGIPSYRLLDRIKRRINVPQLAEPYLLKLIAFFIIIAFAAIAYGAYTLITRFQR